MDAPLLSALELGFMGVAGVRRLVGRLFLVGAAGLGAFLFYGLAAGLLQGARNMSLGGQEFFADVVQLVSIPAFEVGAIVGLAIAIAVKVRTFWAVLRWSTVALCCFVILDAVLTSLYARPL